MTTSIETTNPHALNMLSEAVREIAAYRRDPASTQRLEAASKKIRSALETDPDYLRAIYYDAVVDDLRFQPGEAPGKYQRVLSAIGGDAPFLNEVRYNLGVAYYHGYHWELLEKAIAEFDAVLARSTDPLLRRLTRAARAQAHAMHIIPRVLTAPDPSLIVQYSHRCSVDVRKALQGSFAARLLARSDRRLAVVAARWAAYNASGMRRMYVSDYWDRLDSQQREAAGERASTPVRRLLESAVKDLENAEAERPLDWANWCDMGSAYMRLARVETDARRKTERFEMAEKRLTHVISVLRPNYGFAIYEMGRMHRLAGRFAEAIQLLQRALAIPKSHRDVGDGKVNLELKRAQKGSTDFP